MSNKYDQDNLWVYPMRVRERERIRERIIQCLKNDLLNAQDNVARAEMQQKRMPFDRDNNDALAMYRVWAEETQLAIDSQEA